MKIAETYRITPALLDGTPMQLELPDGSLKNIFDKGNSRTKTIEATKFAVVHFATMKNVPLDKVFYRKNGFYFIEVEAVV